MKVIAILLGLMTVALAQERQPSSDQLLRQMNAVLAQDNARLAQENELLKQELARLRKPEQNNAIPK